MTEKKLPDRLDKGLEDLDDDEVRDAIKSLALNAIKELETIMKYGDLTVKLQVGKAILPHLVRSMKKDAENEEIAELKVRMIEMQDAIKGSSSIKLRVVHDSVVEDTPH